MKRKETVQLEFEKTRDRFKRQRPSMGSVTMDNHIDSSVTFFRAAAASRWTSCFLCEAVSNRIFNFVVFALVLLNACIIGYEVNSRMMQSLEEYDNMGIRTKPTEDWMKVTDMFLIIFFVL